MDRQNFSSGAVWEDIVGYSRAVRMGNTIEVTGTTAVDGGKIVYKGDMYAQAKEIILKVERILKDAGAELSDVVRTRMYVTDISRWEEVARAHSEFFGEIKPATTLIEVSRLIDPDMLIEIEFTAILSI